MQEFWFFSHPQSTTIRFSESSRYVAWGEGHLNTYALEMTYDQAKHLADAASDGDTAALAALRGY